MQVIYAELRRQARKIAAGKPRPDFYLDFPSAVERSRTLFRSSSLIAELLEFVKRETAANPGHGAAHAEAVALDAGAIAAVEGDRAGLDEERIDHIVLLTHCAGLLHDIRRRQPDHGGEGAKAARKKLSQGKRLSPPDIDRIAFAIKNHEAFREHASPTCLEARIISDSLYDADKFRWGPDNFTHTVWDMIESSPLPPRAFARHYPRAMTYIAGIKETFRTATGRLYGPQFIDIGLDIGHELWKQIEAILADDQPDS